LRAGTGAEMAAGTGAEINEVAAPATRAVEKLRLFIIMSRTPWIGRAWWLRGMNMPDRRHRGSLYAVRKC
jgi:hypothetical protein